MLAKPFRDFVVTEATAASGFRLSPEQERVVRHRGGHLQVVACAGSGKTEAISRRISSLVVEGVEPHEIVAFTFTERAAKSLKTRIAKRIVEAKGEKYLGRTGGMYVGTIHSFCLRLLQDNVPRYGNFDVLDENRLGGLLSREHRRLDLASLGTKHWRPILDFIKNSDVVDNELIDSKALEGTAFGTAYLRYKETLNRYHFLTFGMLVSEAVLALEDLFVAKKVRQNLKHLVVDEYQDVNPAQERLISLLAQDPVQLTVVADDDQSIYQWRGSDVGNMLGFRERYSPVTSHRHREAAVQGLQDGPGAAGEDLHLQGLQDGARATRADLPGLQDGARATREDLRVQGLQDGARAARADLPGLQDGARAAREDLHLQGLQDGARAARADLPGLQDGARAACADL